MHKDYDSNTQIALVSLFDCYTKIAEEAFTSIDISSFELFKTNFYARTRYTTLTVLKMLEVLLKESPTSCQAVLENLKEELGFYGSKSHSDLMVGAFESVSKRLGLPATDTILPQVKAFLGKQANIWRAFATLSNNNNNKEI